jgi:hypothetical protein
MNTENKKLDSQRAVCMDSVNGVSKLAPSTEGRIKLSVEGISRMSPVNTNPSIPATQQKQTSLPEKKK